MSEISIVGNSLFCTKKGKPVDLPEALAPLADTHGHLTSFRKMAPAHAVARAALAGVRLLVVPVDPADDVQDASAFLRWFDNVLLEASEVLSQVESGGLVPPVHEGFSQLPPLVSNTYFVAGVHPYGARKFLEDAAVRARLDELLEDPRCKGVGEFGLDYGPWNDLPADVQEEAFRIQLRIAHERGLPVELHLRDGDNDTRAHDDALRVLREEGVPAAGCDLHCFTSGPEVMTPFVELGCHIAFGGAVTFSRSDDIRSAAASCPQELLLCETDSPYMAPVPLRGQECEPAMVAFSAARVSQVRQEAVGEARRSTYEALWNNANSFFGL